MNVARMFVSRMERRIHTFVSKLIHSYFAKINPHHILEKTHIKVFLNIFNQIMEAINKTKEVFQQTTKQNLPIKHLKKKRFKEHCMPILFKTYFENGKTSKAYTRKTQFNNDYKSGAVDFG